MRVGNPLAIDRSANERDARTRSVLRSNCGPRRPCSHRCRVLPSPSDAVRADVEELRGWRPSRHEPARSKGQPSRQEPRAGADPLSNGSLRIAMAHWLATKLSHLPDRAAFIAQWCELSANGCAKTRSERPGPSPIPGQVTVPLPVPVAPPITLKARWHPVTAPNVNDERRLE